MRTVSEFAAAICMILGACGCASAKLAGPTLMPSAPRLNGGRVSLEVVNAAPRRWYAGQFLREPVIAVLSGVVDASECAAYEVTFTPLNLVNVQGQPSGTKVNPRWEAVLGGYRCSATYRWRLADAPGMQDLFIRLSAWPKAVGPDSAGRVSQNAAMEAYAASGVLRLRATAHAPSALSVGVAWVGGVSGIASTSDAERLRNRARTLQPVVFGELPLVLVVRVPNDIPSFADRLRLLAGTTFNDVGYNLYLGLQLSSLFAGPDGAGFPVQTAAGVRKGIGSRSGAFVSVQVNTLALFQTALQGLGVR